jgi:membrane-associated phospholipid phosphatase
MPARLIGPAWRRAATVVALLGAVLAIGLGLAVHHHGATRFDNWAFVRLFIHIGPHGAKELLIFSEPVLTVGTCLLVAVTAALQRQWDLAVLGALGPLVAELVTELVGKPLFARVYGFAHNHEVTGSYPSGHETGVASAAVLLLIVVGRSRLRTVAKAWLAVVLAVWVLLGALGLTRNFYHYLTDTIGAIGVSTAVVLAAALVIDRVSSPGGRGRPRTARGA